MNETAVEEPRDSTEIKETDIVFDCPYCGKSLAIDYRGAGLTIPCTDCGNHVEVPIPDGMELSDIDSSSEEQEVRILNLRRSLATAQIRVEQLEAEIDELSSRRETLEKVRSDSIYRFGGILEKCDMIQSAVKELTEAVRAIAEMAKTDGE